MIKMSSANKYCQKFQKIIYQNEYVQADEETMNELKNHLTSCEACKSEYEKVKLLDERIEFLKDHVPSSENSEEITEAIMKSINKPGKEKRSLANQLRYDLDVVLDWLHYPRFRYTLTTAATILIMIFMFQQYFISSQIMDLQDKIESISEKEDKSVSEKKVKLQMLKSKSGVINVPEIGLANSNDNPYLMIPKDDLIEMIENYSKLKNENDELKRILIREYPGLKELLNKENGIDIKKVTADKEILKLLKEI